ncbi:MAG TPA: tetratricopeptide repeat protein, partial [Ktedonobacteraceae bacterium]
LLEEFEHGVWWVELAALSDPLLVPHTVAAVVGILEQAGCTLTETLSVALRSRCLLLVLDNCEHLLAACAQLVETLLHACPRLRVLATSREALTITGETIWLIPSLRVPDTYHLPPIEGLMTYEAVQLFIERARSVQPSFTLTPENASAVVQVCRHLDGIPLATELAAARIRVLSVEQIAARLNDAYRLLTGGSRTALPRQQTLLATMDWSYNLLSEQERAFFRRLSVFAGGFTLEAAEAVCAGEPGEAYDVLDVLSSLIDKSLALVEKQSGETRYSLLETIRRYAQDKLCEVGEEQLLRKRHRDWFLALAEKAAPESLGKQQVWWYNCLEREQDNLRAALRWSIDRNDDQSSARLGAALWRFWFLRGHLNEGSHWLEQALAQVPERYTLRAEVLHAVGGLAGLQGDPARGYTLLEESIEICRTLKDTQGIAYAMVSLSFLAHNQGDYERAAACGEECLSLLRQLGDKRAIALTLSNLAMTVLYQGDDGRALALTEESLTLYREVGQIRGIASSLANLAMLRLSRGDYQRASTLCQESLVLRQELGDKSGRAHTLALLGRVALSQGEL